MKMQLIKVETGKYKCFVKPQIFDVDSKITILVGINEAGKSGLLELLGKSNYFTDDKDFKLDTTRDYPRKDIKRDRRTGNISHAIDCIYQISGDFLKEIEESFGKSISETTFTLRLKYDKKTEYISPDVNKTIFLKYKTSQFNPIVRGFKSKIYEIGSISDIESILQELSEQHPDPSDEKENTVKLLENLKTYYSSEWNWDDPLKESLARLWLKPNIPKFMYYSEYYSLPSRVNLRNIDELPSKGARKTVTALIELAELNLDDVIQTDDFERFKAELEATSLTISQEIFRYWDAKFTLNIQFDVDRKPIDGGIMPELNIRVVNPNHGVSLPLENRSKGFNWFFSFIVWFSKIQEDTENDYILLLDEPGLNLHALAQDNLLRYLEDLSANYQIIYTTHSPFMIPTDKLPRVRTLTETKDGTTITDSIHQKDQKTLFPLQAALGYDIAQNLFISKNNLLVEGPADLLYLTLMSNILIDEGRTGLNDDITIVPVGGLDKVSTFISLLAGSKLNIVCLLDTFTNEKGKGRVEDLIRDKIIEEKNILFFDSFVNGLSSADIEDVFSQSDYIKLFNEAFTDYKNISISGVTSGNPVIQEIHRILSLQKFNHYKPAHYLNMKGVDAGYFDKVTIDRFEEVFKRVNKLF